MEYSRPSSLTPTSSLQPSSHGQHTTSERLVQGGQKPLISENQQPNQISSANINAYPHHGAYHTTASGVPSGGGGVYSGSVPSQRSLNFQQPISSSMGHTNPIHIAGAGDKATITDHHYAASLSAGQGNNPPRSLSRRSEETFYSARDAQQHQVMYHHQEHASSGYGISNNPQEYQRGTLDPEQGQQSPSSSALFIKRADSVYSAVHPQSTSAYGSFHQDAMPMTNLNVSREGGGGGRGSSHNTIINNNSNMHNTSGVSNPTQGATMRSNDYNYNEKGSFDRHDGLTISRHPSGLNAADAIVNNVPSVRYFAASASMDREAQIQMRREEEMKRSSFPENGGQEYFRHGSVPHHYQQQHLGGGENNNAAPHRNDERTPFLAANAPSSSFSRKPSHQPSSGVGVAAADHQLQPQSSRSRSVAGAARPMAPISAAPSHVQLQQRYGAYSATPSGMRSAVAMAPNGAAAVGSEELTGRTQTLTSSEKIRRLQMSRAQSGGVGHTASNTAQTNGNSNSNLLHSRVVNFSSSHLQEGQHSSLSPSPAAAAARVPSVVGGRGVSDDLSLSPSRPRGGAEAVGSISLPLTRSSVSMTTIATPTTTTPTSGSSSAGKIGGDSKAVKTRLVATHQVKAIDFLRRALLPLHHRGDLTRDDMVVVCSAVCTAYLEECGHSQAFLDETNAKPLSRDDEQLLTTLLLRTLKDLSAIKAGTDAAREVAVVGGGRGRSFVSSPSPAATPTTSMRQGSVGLRHSALYSDAPSSLSNAKTEAKQEARDEDEKRNGTNTSVTLFKQDMQDAAAQTSHLVSRAQSSLEKLKAEENGPRVLSGNKEYSSHSPHAKQDSHYPEDHTSYSTNTNAKADNGAVDDALVRTHQPRPGAFFPPALFQSVSYTISGSFPRSVNNIAYRPRYDARDDSFRLGGGRMANSSDAVLKAALTCPTVHDPEMDSVVIGTVSTYSTVALTWWLAYGPERKVLNLDKMYTNGLVATYEISDTSFILSIKAGALVAGWDYAVYLSVANSEGTAVSAAASFVIPAVSADDLALEYSNERGAGTLSLMQASSARGGRRGSAANGNPFTGRTRDGYFGDLDVREDEVPHRNGGNTKESGIMFSSPPFDPRNPRKHAYAHGVVRGKPLSDLGGASAYYDQRDLELIRQRNEAFANLETERSGSSKGDMMTAAAVEGEVASRTQSIRSKLRTMSATAGNHAAAAESATKGHIDPNYIPPVAAMPATYQEQLRYFFIEQIEPLYYLSPNPAMPEEVFKSIVKDTARRYWFACDKSQQLTDALRREIIDTIKARIAESVLMPPHQRQQIYDLETARAEAEARRQRAEDEEAEAAYVASHFQQQQAEAHRGRGEGPQSSPYQRTYEPQSDSAYYGLTGAY